MATQRRQNLLDGLHVEAMQTRASKKRKRSMGMVGVISFCCGGGMLSSQWTGKNFKHIAGLDINPKYGKTFSKNTGGAPLQDNEEVGAPIQEEVRRCKVREGRDPGVARLLPGVQRQ